MDIDEFERQQQPRAKRSRLEPFQQQIFRLKTKGYANWQICQWLAANEVKVSTEAVRKFIISRQALSNGLAAPPDIDIKPASLIGEQSPPLTHRNTPLPQETLIPENSSALSPEQIRQQREAKASHFINATNPLLKHVKS